MGILPRQLRYRVLIGPVFAPFAKGMGDAAAASVAVMRSSSELGAGASISLRVTGATPSNVWNRTSLALFLI